MNNRSIHWWSGTLLVFLQILAGGYLLWKSSQQDLPTTEILVVLSVLLALRVVIVLFANRVQWNMMVRAIDAARALVVAIFEIDPTPGFADHNKLADALNRMAGRLDDRMHDMRTHQLEQQAIMESIAAAIIAVDHEQHILNSNEASSSVLGLSPKTVAQTRRGAPRTGALGLVTDGLARDDDLNRDIRIYRRGGREINAIGHPIIDSESGDRVGLVIMLDDVTRMRNSSRCVRTLPQTSPTNSRLQSRRFEDTPKRCLKRVWTKRPSGTALK